MSDSTTQHLPNGSTFEENVFARFDAIDARLHALETQAEQRTLDTKPIWERALAELVEVKGELVEVKGELVEVKGELREVKQNLATVGRKLEVLGRDIVQVRADQLDLEQRVEKLEAKPMQ